MEGGVVFIIIMDKIMCNYIWFENVYLYKICENENVLDYLFLFDVVFIVFGFNVLFFVMIVLKYVLLCFNIVLEYFFLILCDKIMNEIMLFFFFFVLMF